MKEDILEQIVEAFLLHRGYFVQHNVKFRPRKDHPDFISLQDSNHSDIDVLGYHPLKDGNEKVWVVSCKSWQNGFNPVAVLSAMKDGKKLNGRDAWRSYRELSSPKWSEAFLEAIKNATGEDRFTYVTAVTHLLADKTGWENHEPFQRALGGPPILIITLQEMIAEIEKDLTTTLAATEVGRMLQLFYSAGMIPRRKNKQSVDTRRVVRKRRTARQPNP